MRQALWLTAMAIVISSPIANTANADSPESTNPLTKTVEVINPMNWRMPKWKAPSWPSFRKSEPARITKKNENIFSTVSQKTASGWNKTKEVLDPTQFLPEKKKAAEPKSKSPGFFSMFSPKPEPQSATTVNEFLAQPHPGIAGK